MICSSIPASLYTNAKRIADIGAHNLGAPYQGWPDGWMTIAELRWLAMASLGMRSAAEVGSWKGRSTLALLSGCKGPVYAVDHWQGGIGADAELNEAGTSDVYQEFLRNVGSSPKLRVIRGDSAASAAFCPPVDMVFIDAGHTYEDCGKDLLAWAPKAQRLICGHDINYPGVARAVDEVLGGADLGAGSIWYVRFA